MTSIGSGLSVPCATMGLGLGLLPCLVADADPALQRWLGPNQVFARDLWLLVHPDLQGSRRVRAVMDAIAKRVTRDARLVVGE